MRIRARRLGRSVLALAAVLVLAGCQLLVRPGWVGDGIHVTGGYWMLTEEPCVPPLGDWCDAAVAYVEDEAADDIGDVAAIAIAHTPAGYRTDRGESILMTTSGWVESLFVIVELRDGGRAVLGVSCEPELPDSFGRLQPAHCWTNDLRMYAVDAPFPPDLGG